MLVQRGHCCEYVGKLQTFEEKRNNNVIRWLNVEAAELRYGQGA